MAPSQPECTHAGTRSTACAPRMRVSHRPASGSSSRRFASLPGSCPPPLLLRLSDCRGSSARGRCRCRRTGGPSGRSPRPRGGAPRSGEDCGRALTADVYYEENGNMFVHFLFFVFDAAANRRWQTRLARSPLGSAARDVRRHPTFIIPCPRPWHARSFEAIGGHSSIHSASAPALFFPPQGPTGPTGVSQIAPRVAQAQAPRAPAGLRLGGPAGWTREFLSKIFFVLACSRPRCKAGAARRILAAGEAFCRRRRRRRRANYLAAVGAPSRDANAAGERPRRRPRRRRGLAWPPVTRKENRRRDPRRISLRIFQ